MRNFPGIREAAVIRTHAVLFRLHRITPNKSVYVVHEKCTNHIAGKVEEFAPGFGTEKACNLEFFRGTHNEMSQKVGIYHFANK